MKIALIIPSYKHTLILEELLMVRLKMWRQHGIDVYIFDSSNILNTKKFVERKIASGFDNLFYRQLPCTLHGNEKVYIAIAQIIDMGVYDYIWICSDGISWNSDALLEVERFAQQQTDMIILSTRDRGNVGLKTYASANDVFNDLAWHLTLMGSIVARCDSLLKNVDFDYLRKKYMTDLCSAFSHVGLYLEQAAKLDRFSAVHLPPYRSRFRNSPIKSASGWYRNRFHVWAKCWTKTVLRLPRCFANKQAAICINGERSGVLREESLCWSRARGVLNLVVFLSYLTRWKRITEYPAWRIGCLSVTPRFIARLLPAWRKKSETFARYKELTGFLDSHKKIAIYGTGAAALSSAALLTLCGRSFDCFLNYAKAAGSSCSDVYPGRVMPLENLLTAPDRQEYGVLIALDDADIPYGLDALRASGIEREALGLSGCSSMDETMADLYAWQNRLPEKSWKPLFKFYFTSIRERFRLFLLKRKISCAIKGAAKRRKRLAILGAGEQGALASAMLDFSGLEFDYFIDMTGDYASDTYCGHPVLQYADFEAYSQKNSFCLLDPCNQAAWSGFDFGKTRVFNMHHLICSLLKM